MEKCLLLLNTYSFIVIQNPVDTIIISILQVRTLKF